MKKILLALSFVTLQLSAQEINFEKNDFQHLDVYDCWINGPFRQGKIEGNVLVVDNPHKDAVNPSSKVLALQRSRFGSNQFGARIDLHETFQLETSYKYVHVLIWKPKAGRSMLVGLGKHPTWKTQAKDVEQFWETSSTPDCVGEWYDAVFPVKGNGGIDIYSLVVCPDCESTHNLKDDFFCYIDDIVVNNDGESRTKVTTAAASKSHGDKVKVNNSDLNGDITLLDDTPLKDYQQTYGKGFTVKINPYKGFICQKVEVVHAGKKETLSAAQISKGTFQIPDSWVDGDITIVGYFNK